MGSCGEIITLQFGHYANFVGTHFWNLQEQSFSFYKTKSDDKKEINNDVLYREGINEKGQVTYTPRLLLVDLKGSLNALSHESELYNSTNEAEKVNVIWDNNIELKKEETLMKNEFQKDLEVFGDIQANKHYNLDNDVNVWSDFLYSRFHPRTINIVNDYQHSEQSFDVFSLGSTAWNDCNFEDAFCDKIRNYVEECDYIQGFQVFHDATNAFSGMASSCLHYLDEEYRKTNFVVPVIPSYYNDYLYKTDEEKQLSVLKDSIRTLNLLFSFTSLRENCSLFAPLCTGKNGWRQPGDKREFYHTKYKPESWYHSSAILAAAIDTFSLKYRLNSSGYILQDLAADLTSYNRKACMGSVCLPFSINIDCDLLECLDNWEGPLTKSITPSCTLGTDQMIQLYSMRGIPEYRLKKVDVASKSQRSLEAYKHNSIKEMLEFYLYCNTHASINNVVNVEKPLVVKTPYPKIFDENVGVNGNIIGKNRPENLDVLEVPILAGLHNGPPIGNMLEYLYNASKKINFLKIHQFVSAVKNVQR